MKQQTFIKSLGLSVAVFTLMGGSILSAETNPKPVAAAAQNVGETSINQQLSKLMTEAKYDGTALTDVLDAIRDKTDANIQVDWKELEAIGVTKETPITLNFKHIKTSKVLKSILEAAAPGKLIYYVDQNVLHVTTISKADTIMVTTVHDVRDLLVTTPDFEGPNLDLTSQGNSQSQGSRGSGNSSNSGGGSGGGLFGNSGGQNKDSAKDKTRDERAQELIDIIQKTIRPEVWTVNGGTATIKYLNGTLIITAPVTLSAEL